MDVLGFSILSVGTVFFVAFSWRSFRHPGSHGFFRFFALEAILCLLVLNAPAWFRQPFSTLQLVSWPFLIISLGLAIHGFYLLRHLGQPSKPEPGSHLFRIENTASLVTAGAYGIIRHPLYASLLCLVWGAALKSLTPVTAILAAAATVFLVATAKSEEVENLERFGEAFRRYMARTWLFIPFVL